jgi:hypothetical protein
LEEYPLVQRVSYQISGMEPNTDKEPCSSCGQTMHIRRHPVTREAYVLNKEDAYSLDSMRLANLYLKVSADPFSQFVSRSADDNRSVADLIWGFLDRRRLAALKKGDWNTVSKVLLEKARYRCGIGKAFFSIQQDALRYQLRGLQEKGATHVRVATGHDALVCPKCAELGGAVFTIEEALEKMPLPVRCDNAGRRVAIDNDPGWCRCFYVRRDEPS